MPVQARSPCSARLLPCFAMRVSPVARYGAMASWKKNAGARGEFISKRISFSSAYTSALLVSLKWDSARNEPTVGAESGCAGNGVYLNLPSNDVNNNNSVFKDKDAYFV